MVYTGGGGALMDRNLQNLNFLTPYYLGARVSLAEYTGWQYIFKMHSRVQKTSHGS